MTLIPWWMPDPNLTQGGISLVGECATGDCPYGRSSLGSRLAVQLPSDLRFGLEVGVGTSWGAAPAQKLWYVGEPGVRNAFELDDGLYSVGVGLSILDGLIRMNSAWGLKRPRGFRFDFYLDAIR
ncbi:MAG: hypothetical protein GWP44_05035 [Proteobacteria bacterium]|nr:hypothetical protein [Pseudomonadota bacterium]